MIKRVVLFLDDGDVISDNRRRAAQWQKLLGEFLPPVLGGSAATWGEANYLVISTYSGTYLEDLLVRAGGDFRAFRRLEQVEWMRRMCEYVGVPVPPEEQCLEVAERAWRHVIPKLRPAFPGAVEAIRRLRAMGYDLHTASGDLSDQLELYLAALGIRDCFGRLYGPDLVGVLKTGPEFYQRVFADAGVPPVQAVVVDDKPQCVAWAQEVGARGVLVGAAERVGAPAPAQGPVLCLASLADLPSAIGTLG
ncbi:MAG: HAD-IA family hydrolase [Firmicutes bacterium]|nr:HAD-IA family hydrolase [Bacillota bacterium]